MTVTYVMSVIVIMPVISAHALLDGRKIHDGHVGPDDVDL